MTNGGVTSVRNVARLYREATNKRDAATAAKLLREYGFDPETVDSLSDAEIKLRLSAQTHPSLK
jgi:hypothetical protein